MKNVLLAAFASLFLSCNSSDADAQPESSSFPPLSGSEWQTSPLSELGWDAGAATDLREFLDEKNTRAFIILVDGKIVMEEYFDGQTASSPWYWASAGKTLTTATTGIAQQEGHLDVEDKVSDYLETGWTSAPHGKEDLITVRHLLTMTSGLDDTMGDDVSQANLHYLADAGSRWAYANVYVKLQDVVAQASGEPFAQYFNTRLRDRIGMTGTWIPNGGLSVYWSNARSMARFGLLMLNRGKWENEVILDQAFFDDATQSSQAPNQAYGYMWWLNGKQSYMLPQTQFNFSGSLVPTGPTDMVMALGKNDQKIYVVPSKNMVVIRMGNAADGENFALSGFDQALWEKISALYE